jgi:hypothetical protein
MPMRQARSGEPFFGHGIAQDILKPPKGAASVKYIEAIDPDSAGFQSSGQAVRFGDVTSPNGCGQSIAGYSDGVERARARWIAAF